jgi:hypothetical protein
MPFLLQAKKYIILGAITIAIIFGAWKYYTYTENQIQTYRTNAALAAQAQQSSEAALHQVQSDISNIRTEFAVVQQKFLDASNRVSLLEKKLSEHDLGYLAQSKPKLVENMVDKATQDVVRCFEIESGSPLTKEETNAKKPSEINSSCSDIANPNYHP